LKYTLPSTESRLRGQGGFTLVELLVVIAIIGLLVALALPAIGKARAYANMAGATSQMRSIGRAFASYAGDHNNMYPVPWNYPIRDSTQLEHWASELARTDYAYLGPPTIYVHQGLIAPGVHYTKPGGGEWKPPILTYTPTYAICKWIDGWNRYHILEARSVLGVARPSQTYILFQGKQRKDQDGWSTPWPIGWDDELKADMNASSAAALQYVDFPYNGTGLFLKADGSIVAMRQEQLKDIKKEDWLGN
jgi:prepilin-type N-terminal cleavage/methylation domain-containing protein